MPNPEERRLISPSSLQRVTRTARRWVVFSLAAWSAACGSRAVDLDGDAGSVNVNANPDAIAPGVSPLLEDQANAMKIIVDDDRVYWLEAFYDRLGAPRVSIAGVRSCLKNDCRATITTYESGTRGPGPASSPEDALAGDYVALAVAGDNVYWAEMDAYSPKSDILTCPSSGCVGASRVIVSDVTFGSMEGPMAVDESYVYWISPVDSAVFRAPISGTGTPETIAVNESNPDQLVVDGSFAYWIERANEANAAIKRAPKQGGGPTVTLAMAQNKAMALNVDAEFVYWANVYSVGSILRCPVSGCPAGPEVIVANQPWIRALVANGNSIGWIAPVDDPTTETLRAAMKRCPMDGCASAVETVAVHTFASKGMSMAVSRNDLYWVAQGLNEPSTTLFPHATIYHHRN